MKTNEPVALMHPTYKNRILPIDAPYANVGTSDWIPLYTHPHSEESVKAKTLTDEEIYKIAMEVQTGFLPQDDTLAFARAILRKAQEK